MKRSILFGISLLSILLLLATWGFSQAISGDLVGVVKDTTGAVVPNATVEATNVATGAKSTQKTNAQGEYHFVNLPVGTYSVGVTAAGLNGRVDNVRVELNQTQTANLTAAVAGTSTAIEVSETGVTVDSTTPTIASTYLSKEAADLPITAGGQGGSGVLNLSLLDAGVASSGGVGAGSGPAVSGNRPRNNNFTVEGVDNNSLSVTGPLITIPNDAVESFTVLQNQFSAEFGHSSGGQFNQTIKSGTNTFHGRAYEYFQNRDLNAVDSLTALGGQTSNPRYDNNRFGGQIGGPIIKNKLFFFTDWEYNPLGEVPVPPTSCAPTAAGYSMLNSLFPNNTNLQQFEKYVPASTASASACNPTIQVNPGVPTQILTGRNAGNANPVFGVGAVDIPVGDVTFFGPAYFNTLSTANSFDWNIGQNDSLRGRLAWTKYSASDVNAQLPAFWSTTQQRYWLITLAEYHNFGTSVNNEFRFGFNRYSQLFPLNTPSFPGLNVFPNLEVFELGNIQLGPDTNLPQETIQNLYQFIDNVSWVKGKHTFRFGGEFRWIISPQSFTQRVRGDYEWQAMSDYLNDFYPITLGNDFAERSAGDVIYYGNKKAFYGYANDAWRISPTVTLNLGLRYEYTGEPLGTQLQALNSLASVPGLINFTAPTAQKTNFMPRVGVAWAPDANTSVRAGFAMANDVIYDNLGILSLPPQVNQTCDTGQPQSSACNWSNTAFLANGGLPATPSAVTDPAKARAATSAYIPNQTLPYTITWDASVQRQFAKIYTLEVRYVYTHGIKLPVQQRLNRQAEVQPWAYLPTYLSAPSQATLNSLPYTITSLPNGCSTGPCAYPLSNFGNFVPAYANAGFNANNIVAFEPLGQSKYNGLDVKLTRTFTHGLQFQAAYTWSHLLDNSTADVFSTLLTPRRPQDFQCFNCDMGTSALDRRQRFTAFGIWDVPWFKNDNWFLKNVVGNWQFSPIYTLQSPEYATCQSATDSNINGDNAGDRCIYNPAGVPGTTSTVSSLRNSNGEIVAYLAKNPTAQYIQAQSGAFATTARNTIATPWINNWDASLLKRINITERQSIEFSATALNLFNHPQYVPGWLSDVASFGTAAINRNVLVPGQSVFEQWNQVFSNHPRNLILALKYNF
jgi:hypothetical protein